MASLTPRIDRLQKNYIINGDMRIAQRNTTFSAVANGAYTLDRYVYYKVGAMVHTVTQDTDVPTLAQAGHLFSNSLRLNLTTPDTAIAAGDVAAITQKIEGYNFAKFAQKDFTLSFWVKATTPGIYCVAFQSSTNDRSYVVEYTINVANTWEKKVLNISATPASGTWNYTTGIGLEVNWTLAAGSNFQQTAGTWQANAGAKYATVNQVNGVNTGATDFRLTGIVLSEGTYSDPEYVSFGKDFEGELAACLRYYEKSYAMTLFAGAIDGNGVLAGTRITNGSTTSCNTVFKVVKRTNPTVVTYSTNNGAAGFMYDLSAGTNDAQTGIAVNTNGIGVVYCGVARAVGNGVQMHWTADAEL